MQAATPIPAVLSSRMVSSMEKLGEGTFAEVFGSETELGESLAIKVHRVVLWHVSEHLMPCIRSK